MAALVPLILVAGFWIKSELDRSQRDIDMFLSAQASTLSQRIDGEIRQQMKALRAIAALPDLDQPGAGFTDAARRIAGAMSHWSALSLVDTNTGEAVLSTGSAAAVSLSRERLAEARTAKQPFVESRLSPTSHAILIAYPVVREDRAERVLVVEFDARELQDVVQDQGRSMNLAFKTVDARGLLIASWPEAPSAFGRPVSPPLLAQITSSRTGTGEETSPEGETGWNSFIHSDLTGWATMSSMSGRQAERLAQRSLRATIAAGALSLVLAGILAVFIIHNVMERRVSEERIAASRALGDLDARLLATTQDALDEQRKASSEREVLLREIYHRVKNNLQIVQSLLRLGSRDLKPEQREPFESAVRRIGAMARVHTLLYNSPDLASIDFRDYLEELLKELSEGFAAEERSIQSALEAASMRMPLDTAVPLAFIAVEILTNAFKHAFPEGRGGRIVVEVRREAEDAVLSIRDDGIGLSPDAAGKRRLGLTIVRKLVGQIGGTLEEPAPGSSTFVVRFPIREAVGSGFSSAAREPQPETA